MLWNLVVFGLIGLFTGGAARLFYPGRQPIKILGTMVLGIVGALLGGLLSWSVWSEVDSHFDSGALLMSLGGAVLVLILCPCLVYARNMRGRA